MIYQNYKNLHFTNYFKLFVIFRTFNMFVLHPVCWLWQQKTCATRSITKSEFVLWKIMYSARLYNQYYVRYIDRYWNGDYMVSHVLRSKKQPSMWDVWLNHGLINQWVILILGHLNWVHFLCLSECRNFLSILNDWKRKPKKWQCLLYSCIIL